MVVASFQKAYLKYDRPEWLIALNHSLLAIKERTEKIYWIVKFDEFKVKKQTPGVENKWVNDYGREK